jgi:hypothetical protein
VRVRRILFRRRIVHRHRERMARHPSRHVHGLAGDRKAGAKAGDRGLAFQGRRAVG